MSEGFNYLKKAINFLAARSWETKNVSLLDAITLYIVENTGVEYAFIDLYDDQVDGAVSTLSICHEGNIIENITYDLAGTPCEHVTNRSFCSHHLDVQQKFPNDQMLKDLRIASYAGTPTYSNDGNVNGLIGIMHDGEFDELKVSSLIQIFSPITGAYIETIASSNLVTSYENMLSKLSALQLRHISGTHRILFNDFLDLILSATGSEYGLIGEVAFTPSGKPFLQVNAITNILWGVETQEKFLEINSVGQKLVNFKGMFDTCNMVNEIIISDDVLAASTVKKEPQRTVELNEFVGIPLKNEDKIIGMIGLAKKPDHPEIQMKAKIEVFVHSIEVILKSINAQKNFQTLQKSERQTSEALDLHAIVSSTDRQGKITYVNDMFCKISGYSRDELLGKTHSLINSGEHSKKFYQEMYNVITAGKTWVGEFKNRTKTDGYYWVRSTIHPLVSAKGKIDGYISIRTDITAEKEAYEEQLLETLQKDTFISNISHELRTPLNGIVGFATMLDGTDLSSEQREYLDNLELSADLLERQLNQIVALKNIDTSVRGTCYLDETVGNIMKILKPLMSPKNISATINMDAKYLIDSDVDIVQSVLQNILVNAVKYNKQDGTITLSTQAKGPSVEISIKDSGVGIPEANKANIFKRFTRGRHSNSNIPGTGLGLAIVKERLDAIGGAISFSSDGKSFTEFQITLPILKMS